MRLKFVSLFHGLWSISSYDGMSQNSDDEEYGTYNDPPMQMS